MDDLYTEARGRLLKIRRKAVGKQWVDDVAISYIRFSEQGRQARGQSVSRQESRRDAWLKRNPGVRLRTDLVLLDPGVSARHGAHRTDPKHAMTQFLQRVEEGDVRPGTYLIVENLDRLSREHPVESMRWILNLLAKGLRIVQLAPREQVYDQRMNESELSAMLDELKRSHAESERKSTLLAPKWAEKKQDARQGIPHGKAVPAWLELIGGAYCVRPGLAEALRLAYQRCAAGHGIIGITRALNASNIPAPTASGLWTRSYVARILSSRAVTGEYQPFIGHKPRRPPNS